MVTDCRHLFEVQGDGDPVKLPSVLDAGTLPPAVGPIDGVGDGMAFWKQTHPSDTTLFPLRRLRLRASAPTSEQHRVGVTPCTVGVLHRASWNVLHQLTVDLRSRVSTGGVAVDDRVTGQVQDGGKQA